MVCDECRTSADGECGNEHRQSGRRERRRRRVQDEESRRGCGERAGEGDERDDRDRGELLRRVAAASAPVAWPVVGGSVIVRYHGLSQW